MLIGRINFRLGACLISALPSDTSSGTLLSKHIWNFGLAMITFVVSLCCSQPGEARPVSSTRVSAFATRTDRQSVSTKYEALEMVHSLRDPKSRIHAPVKKSPCRMQPRDSRKWSSAPMSVVRGLTFSLNEDPCGFFVVRVCIIGSHGNERS
jgi:hypothetical protein